jgi:hypothetical protein
MQVLTTAPWHAHPHASAHNGATPLVLRCAILRQECSLFERLKSAQARAAVGSARAARLHARALRLAGGAAALDELLAARHSAVSSTCMRVDALLAARHGAVSSTCMRVDALLAAPAAVEAENVAAVEAEDVAGVAGVAGVAAVVHVEGISSHASAQHGVEDTHASAQHDAEGSLDECVTLTHASAQHDAEGSLDECVTLVSEWLLGLAASDVSLMLAIERVREARGTDAAAGSGAHAQPVDDLLAPGVVVLADRLRFCYRLAVVDIRPKPTRKVEEHAELDATMVAHWTARGGPPATRCSI